MQIAHTSAILAWTENKKTTCFYFQKKVKFFDTWTSTRLNFQMPSCLCCSPAQPHWPLVCNMCCHTWWTNSWCHWNLACCPCCSHFFFIFKENILYRFICLLLFSVLCHYPSGDTVFYTSDTMANPAQNVFKMEIMSATPLLMFNHTRSLVYYLVGHNGMKACCKTCHTLFAVCKLCCWEAG